MEEDLYSKTEKQQNKDEQGIDPELTANQHVENGLKTYCCL